MPGFVRKIVNLKVAGRFSFALLLFATIGLCLPLLLLWICFRPEVSVLGQPPVVTFGPRSGWPFTLTEIVFYEEGRDKAPESVAWRVRSYTGMEMQLPRLVYGEIPGGWVQDKPADPISEGASYRMVVKRKGGQLRFHIPSQINRKEKNRRSRSRR